MTAFVAASNYPVGFLGQGRWRVLIQRAVQQVAQLVFWATGNAKAAQVGGVPTEELITRFQQGQPRAFEALYDRYKDYVYRTSFFVLRHREEAEEATQETFLDLLKALPNYDIHGSARFETWLYRVTVNRCRSRMRRKKLPSAEWDDVEARLERLPSGVSERPESVYLEQERAVQLWRAVDQLPTPHREVLILRYQQDLSYDEISQALDIRLGTVKSRLYNAHKKLKDLLDRREE